MHLPKVSLIKLLALSFFAGLILMSLFAEEGFGVQLTATTEYSNYVHNGVGVEGNYTYIEKPVFPVTLNNNTVPVGGNWTIIGPLEADHNYHVYCYGAWVDTTSAARTDYDINVYDPSGNLESSHTEAAGFPEHLGTTTNDALFTPKQSGNYSFIIKNDARESEGAQQATFMIVEALSCDQWHEINVEGKSSNGTADFRTCLAYEFITNESKVELYAKVPDSLDMYEARLYLMNDAKSLSINSYPLPWEPGLYGNLSAPIGGYNFETEGYRGVAYASCEYMGKDMFLNYTTASTGVKLYQLVLIGEEGSGNIELMMKSHFENATLTPITVPSRIYPGNPTEIAYAASNATLEEAQLSYTTSNWTDSQTVSMVVSGKTCNATIPGQEAGSYVEYRIDASDTLQNNLTATGNYCVKEQLRLNITAAKETIRLGENITVTGTLTPSFSNSVVAVQFSTANATQIIDCPVNATGFFTAQFQPDASTVWAVTASSAETQMSYACDSGLLKVTVQEPPLYIKYGLYIVIGLVAAGAGVGVFYFIKSRRG